MDCRLPLCIRRSRHLRGSRAVVWRLPTVALFSAFERAMRFELTTLALARRCSTTELYPHGAGTVIQQWFTRHLYSLSGVLLTQRNVPTDKASQNSYHFCYHTDWLMNFCQFIINHPNAVVDKFCTPRML